MAFELWLVGAFVGNLVVGILLVVGVFKFMEQRVPLGAFGGITAGTLVIYVQATIGEEMLHVTVGEMKQLVLAAALGAVIGVVGTMLVIKPEI